MKIGVVGAGITGLVLARALERRGLDPVVFEATDSPGGVIRSTHLDGRVLEHGPQRTRLTAPIDALIRELGLADELVTARPGLPLYVYHAGRLRRVPFSAGEALRTDLLSWRGKARILAEPLARGPRDDETVASFLTRSFGREAYERMLGPLYGGLYASDPEDMLARLTIRPALAALGIRGSMLAVFLRRSLRRGAEIPPASSFRGGLQTLPHALTRALGDRVRLGTPVHAIRRVGDAGPVAGRDTGAATAATAAAAPTDAATAAGPGGSDGDEHRSVTTAADAGFELDAGGDVVVHVDRVVLTTPADTTAELLERIAPDAASRLRRLRYNPLAIVHLLAPAARLEGLGCQVSFAEDLVTRGVTWNTSLFPDAGRHGVFTSFLGGAGHPEIETWTDERIGEAAIDEFRRITDADARVLRVTRTRMPAWDRSWTALEGLELPEGVLACANWESRAGIPGRISAAERLAERLAQSG